MIHKKIFLQFFLLFVCNKSMLGSTENALTFGTLMDLSSHLAASSEQIRLGLELGFKKINDAGGIHGKQLNLMVLDDSYDPPKARALALEFINNHKIDILINALGAPTTAAYIDLIKEKKILSVFPVSWETRFRNKDYSYLLNYRATVGQEGNAMAHYAINKLSSKKIVVFYQNDIESIDEAKDYFKKINFKDILFVVYQRRETNFQAQVKEIVDFNPDTIILMSTSTAAVELIRQIGIEKLYGKNLLCWAWLYSEAFKKSLNNKGLKPIWFSTIPDLSSDLPIVHEFVDIASKNNSKPDPMMFGGYLSAVIFGEILKRTKEPVTKEAIVEAYENIKNLNIGGIELNFDPQKQTLHSKIWIETGSSNWSEYKMD